MISATPLRTDDEIDQGCFFSVLLSVLDFLSSDLLMPLESAFTELTTILPSLSV